jgi:hypothetical protein
MNYRDLQDWVDADPFRPFRLGLTNGRSYDILHASMIWPGRRTVMIGQPDDPAEPDVPGDHITVALVHITEIEPLSPAMAG